MPAKNAPASSQRKVDVASSAAPPEDSAATLLHLLRIFESNALGLRALSSQVAELNERVSGQLTFTEDTLHLLQTALRNWDVHGRSRDREPLSENAIRLSVDIRPLDAKTASEVLLLTALR